VLSQGRREPLALRLGNAHDKIDCPMFHGRSIHPARNYGKRKNVGELVAFRLQCVITRAIVMVQTEDIMELKTKPPMTGKEAREGVEIMRRETSIPAQKRLLQVALGPVGNLSEDARAVYMRGRNWASVNWMVPSICMSALKPAGSPRRLMQRRRFPMFSAIDREGALAGHKPFGLPLRGQPKGFRRKPCQPFNTATTRSW